MANYAQIALQLYDKAIEETEIHFSNFCEECKELTKEEIIEIIKSTRNISADAATGIYVAMEKRFK